MGDLFIECLRKWVEGIVCRNGLLHQLELHVYDTSICYSKIRQLIEAPEYRSFHVAHLIVVAVACDCLTVPLQPRKILMLRVRQLS